MNHLPVSKHWPALIFIAVTIVLLLVFWIQANGIRDSIEASSHGWMRFVAAFLELKSEFCDAASRNRGGKGDFAPLLRIDACQRLFEEASSGPLENARSFFAPEAFKDMPGQLAELLELARSMATGKGGEAERDRFAALSGEFKQALDGRQAFIDSLALHQVKAIRTVQFFIVAAIMGLVLLAAWTLWFGARAELEASKARDLVLASLAAQERERERIALELHDSVAQDLAAALMRAQGIPSDEAGQHEALVAELRKAIGTLRQVSWNLRPPELESLGLTRAAIELVENFGLRHGVETEVKVFQAGREPVGDAALHVYRIVSEAVANIRRHAGAGRVSLSVGTWSGTYVLEIEDDGGGFDTGTLDGKRTGQMGLTGMRERAQLAGGRLDIVSAPGKGTRIRVEVPLPG